MSRVTTSESALKEANSLFVDENFEAALERYNEAVELDSENAEAFLKRSACLYKLEKYTESLSDANQLIKLQPGNSKAYLRKGMAAFELEEFETARAAFEKGAALDPANTQFRTWIRKCNAELEAEGGAPAASSASASPAVAPTAPPQQQQPAAEETPAAPAAAAAPVAPVPAKPKVRHEWYQTSTDVVVEIFAKNVSKDKASIDIGDKTLDVKFPLGDSTDYAFNVELANPILPASSKVNFLSTKIEIKLKKATGITWKTLEDTGERVAPPAPGASSSATTKAPQPKKDWDAIAKDAIGEEKLEGEEGLNKLFQDIFANGSDEQKKAMMKSFTESGGTVLSTNWDEVGKKKVDGSPPDGMVMHKWNEP